MGSGEEGFNQTLRRLRLEHAALLLKNTHMSINEITDACGYLSSTYFIAAFKKYFRVSPGKYRCINQ
jgi:AraC-like DNA-binding protein